MNTQAVSKDTLPKIQIRNLRAASQRTATQDSLVRISGTGYDHTISSNPAATLKYRDEEDDTITLGSSAELIDKLAEPVPQPSGSSSRKSKDRMSIAMLLSEAQQSPESLNHHTFDIEEREEIQKLWQEIQRRNKTPPPPALVDQKRSRLKTGREAPTIQLRNESFEFEHSSAPIPSILGYKKPTKHTGTKQTTLAAERGTLKVQPPCEGIRAQAFGKFPDGLIDMRCKGDNVGRNSVEEEKRDRLASIYDRLKSNLWAPIAIELGITSQQAENLHWSLGKGDMARRAEKMRSSKPNSSGDHLSVKSTDGDWHEDRDPKPQSSAVNRNLEDYRAPHFKMTMPPQAQNANPLHQSKSASSSDVEPLLGKRTSGGTSSTKLASVLNLTVEGKRQAQAAGDMLRARAAPSRFRKAGMSVTDHTSHQNRWAEYTSSDSAFSSKVTKSVPQGFAGHTLTSEGRRQAQAAGDKLRCRTNPIRHPRPSRSGSLEGVNKNRWSSYATGRTTRSDESHQAGADLSQKLPSKIADATKVENQPSLLEVFENELAKNNADADDSGEETTFPDPEIDTIPETTSEPNLPANNSGNKSAPMQSGQPLERPNFLVDGFKIISNHLQGINAAKSEEPHNLSKAIEDGVRTAAEGFDALMEGLTGSLQEVSDRTQEAADRTLKSDTQGIEETITGLRDFVVNLAAGLSTPGGRVSSPKPTSDEAEHSHNVPDSSHPEKSPEPHINEAIDAASNTKVPHVDISVDVSSRPERETSLGSKLAAREKAQPGQGLPIRTQNVMGQLRYHKPGPIHLPHHIAPSKSDLDNKPSGITRDNHVDRPHQRHATEDFYGTAVAPTSSPPTAATRFPTLAQFEGQNFAVATSFPALPSMEPLMPQRAGSNSVETVPDTHSLKMIKPEGTLSKTSKQKSLDAAMSMNADKWLDTQLAPFQQQNLISSQFDGTTAEDSKDINGGLDTPPKSAQIYGQHRAPSCRLYPSAIPAYTLELSRSDYYDHDTGTTVKNLEQHDRGCSPVARPILDSPNTRDRTGYTDIESNQDDVNQLMALERKNKERLLRAQQSWENASDDPKLPGAFPKEQTHTKQNTEGTSAEAIKRFNRFSEYGFTSQSRPDADARLAAPFDPSDVEPAARPHLTEGIRRHATVAGTDSKQNAQRRRPYSEAYDGFGRLAWDSFMGHTQHENDEFLRHSGANRARRQGQIRKSGEGRKVHKRQEQLRRSVTLHNAKPWNVSSKACEDEQREDPAIRKCVDLLKQLEYGNDEAESEDRLWVYAQAAKGDLDDAIDIIEDEQKAYSERL